eukprot:gene31212-6361_t
MPSYEESVSFLQTLPSSEGSSIYEHLTRIIAKVLEEKPSAAIDLLETSLLTKKTAFNVKESSPLVPVNAGADAAKTSSTAKLFGNPDLPIDPETGEPIEAETPNDYQSEDVLYDAALLDALGVGVGREEMYNVSVAVKALGECPKRKIATVRFFGKFYGLHADYYVFETTLKNAPAIPQAPDGECPYEPGTGANAYIYYVCNYLGGEFTQLPFVKPDDIKAARTIKKLLTGRLTSAVSTFPTFEGTEANYLRAQIARIGCTTVCCPTGLFEPGEEEGTLEKNEEWEGLPGKEANTKGAWVHRYPHMKKQGRCELYKREPPEEEEEEFEETEEEQEEGPEALGSLEEDTPLADGADPENPTSAWGPLVSSSNENVKNQVGGLRSFLWPGAVMACKDKAYTNIYVGWGVKAAPFVPQPPPPVAQEFDQGKVESLELPLKPVPPPPEEEEEDA